MVPAFVVGKKEKKKKVKVNGLERTYESGG
jgi:hypothetical protein